MGHGQDVTGPLQAEADEGLKCQLEEENRSSNYAALAHLMISNIFLQIFNIFLKISVFPLFFYSFKYFSHNFKYFHYGS